MPDCKHCGEKIENAKLTDGTPVVVEPNAEWALVTTVSRSNGEIRLSPKPVRQLHTCLSSLSSHGAEVRDLR